MLRLMIGSTANYINISTINILNSHLSGMLAKGQVDVPIPMHIGIHESEVRIYFVGVFNAIAICIQCILI